VCAFCSKNLRLVSILLREGKSFLQWGSIMKAWALIELHPISHEPGLRTAAYRIGWDK